MNGLRNWDVKSLQKIDSIPQYWESLKPQSGVAAEAEGAWKKKIEFIDALSVQNNVVVFLWNAFTNRFLYMSDRLKVLSDLNPDLFTAENGVEYSLSRFHPDHLAAVMQLSHTFISYCFENSIPDNKTVSMYINYLYKNGDDQYVQVLQRGIILEADENNKPLLTLSIIHYVGHIKKKNSVGGVLCTPGQVLLYNFNLDKKTLDEAKVVSDQEKKILKLLSRGLDTKQIAKNLAISPNTVNTHRRNLIKKTNCADSTAVVAFAQLIGLL